MKKLALSQLILIMTLLTLGVFFLVFSLMHGWSTAGQDRYFTAAVSSLVAGLFATGVFIGVDSAIAAGASIAVIVATGTVTAIAAGANIATTVVAAIAIALVLADPALGSEGSEIVNHLNISRKWLPASLALEAAIIFGVITAVTLS